LADNRRLPSFQTFDLAAGAICEAGKMLSTATTWFREQHSA
jgi:hypothetical protein